MNTESNYDMNEKEVLINILNKHPLMDTFNIYKIIENMIYEEVEEYYDIGETLKCKYTLRFGEKDGLYQIWRENGKKYKECHYRDSKLDGLYQSWWYNGQKKIKCTYQDGKLEGCIKDGTIMVKK